MKRSQHVYAIVLTGEQINEAISLLKTLRMHLKSAVESALLPGEKEPREEIDRLNVSMDRGDYREAGKLLRLLREAQKE